MAVKIQIEKAMVVKKITKNIIGGFYRDRDFFIANI